MKREVNIFSIFVSLDFYIAKILRPTLALKDMRKCPIKLHYYMPRIGFNASDVLRSACPKGK